MTRTGYANPYLICGECKGWVTATTNGFNVPCGHEAPIWDVCPSWSPVDGCCCEQMLGRKNHGEPPDELLGLYTKYVVNRLDDPDGKHDGCLYFVLDPRHDKFAAAALDAYVEQCREEYPDLATALNDWVENTPYEGDK